MVTAPPPLVFSEERLSFPPGFSPVPCGVGRSLSTESSSSSFSFFHFGLWMLRSVKFPPLSFDTAVQTAVQCTWLAPKSQPKSARGGGRVGRSGGYCCTICRGFSAQQPDLWRRLRLQPTRRRSLGGRFVTSCLLATKLGSSCSRSRSGLGRFIICIARLLQNRV